MTSPATAPLSDRQSPFTLLARRIWGLALRHIYLHTGSLPRLIEMLYWPVINMMVFGFVSLYFVTNYSNAVVIGSLLMAAVLLNEIFLRVNVTMLLLFMEEIWSRNLGHLFASPISFTEYVSGMIGLALVRTTISLIPAIIVAQLLFHFSLFSLGWPVATYIPLLCLNGCWYGLLILAMLLRYGLAAEWLAWMATWLMTPLIAPYYPVSILPEWLQCISWSLPATYVFESLKSQLAGNGIITIYLWKALILNFAYFVAAGFIFYRAYQGARRRGGLLQVGE